MADDYFRYLLLKAVDEMLIVSIDQFGLTDLNNERNIAEVYDLNSSLAEAVNAFPPKKFVRSVFVQTENNTVTDIIYEYSDSPVSPKEIAFIIDNEWTEKLTNNHFYGSGD